MRNRALRIGIDDAPPVPMQMGDPVSGTFRGYEVDLLKLVADRLDCTNEFRRAWWSLITEELVSGKLDMVCSAATVTELRKNEVSFCEPHLWIKLALVVRQNTADLPGRESPRFGVRRSTTAEEFLRMTLGHEPVMQSESNDELYQALSKGHIDAVIDDSPIARHFADSIGGLHYSGAYEGTSAGYAIMLAKNNDALRQELNAILLSLEAEGALLALRQRWFGTSAMLIA